jgi:hypothetical protein
MDEFENIGDSMEKRCYQFLLSLGEKHQNKVGEDPAKSPEHQKEEDQQGNIQLKPFHNLNCRMEKLQFM